MKVVTKRLGGEGTCAAWMGEGVKVRKELETKRNEE